MRPSAISFPVLLQDFFLRRLVEQRGASARTIESYRDAFELLLGFIEQRTSKQASALSLADLDSVMNLTSEYINRITGGRRGTITALTSSMVDDSFTALLRAIHS